MICTFSIYILYFKKALCKIKLRVTILVVLNQLNDFLVIESIKLHLQIYHILTYNTCDLGQIIHPGKMQ